MISRECASKSAVLANSNNWLSKTGQWNYILNWITSGCADCIMIDSL